MSQQTFFRMIFTSDGRQWSKLESFLASSVLVKQFSRAVSEVPDQPNPTVNNLLFNLINHQSFFWFRFVLYQTNKIHIE